MVCVMNIEIIGPEGICASHLLMTLYSTCSSRIVRDTQVYGHPLIMLIGRVFMKWIFTIKSCALRNVMSQYSIKLQNMNTEYIMINLIFCKQQHLYIIVVTHIRCRHCVHYHDYIGRNPPCMLSLTIKIAFWHQSSNMKALSLWLQLYLGTKGLNHADICIANTTCTIFMYLQ